MTRPEQEILFRWYTEAGLRAIAIRQPAGHLCGYVEVPRDHPLHGVSHDESTEAIGDWVEEEKVGKKGAFLVMLGALEGGGKVPRTPEFAIDVHGGITYSRPPAGDDWFGGNSAWFYGFGCAHADDMENPKDLPFVMNECESMAEQLVRKLDYSPRPVPGDR